MSYHVEILSPSDVERILEFATRRLTAQISDETERTFAAWRAAWRPEALDHYMKLGWSFGVFQRQADDQLDGRRMQLAGFAMVQPFLFFRGQTQTLWAEYLDSTTDEALHLLVDFTIRMARDKHIQRVLFQNGVQLKDFVKLQAYGSQASLLADGILEVRTTKG